MRLEGKLKKRLGQTGAFDREDIREADLGVNLCDVEFADLTQTRIGDSFGAVENSLQHLAPSNFNCARGWPSFAQVGFHRHIKPGMNADSKIGIAVPIQPQTQVADSAHIA